MRSGNITKCCHLTPKLSRKCAIRYVEDGFRIRNSQAKEFDTEAEAISESNQVVDDFNPYRYEARSKSLEHT